MKFDDEIKIHAEKIKERLENNLSKNAYDRAMNDRGLAFIAAAKIVLLYNLKKDATKEAPDAEITNIMDGYVKGWKNQQKTLENFQELLSKLQILLKENGVEKAKKALENAENIAAWKQRESIETVIAVNLKKDGAEIIQKRRDVPITTFTKEQERQWCLIFAGDTPLEKLIQDKIGIEHGVVPTNKEKPDWFIKLQPWEQKYHRTRLTTWAQTQPLQNLGDFLGVPPTTIRGYPGIRNAYMSYVQTYIKKEKTGDWVLTGEIAKVRSGHVSPDKMKNPNERLGVIKENIKQMILASAREKIKNGETYLLFDLQTLISPPFDYTMDNDRLEAVTQLRKELDGEKFKHFLEQNVSEPEKPIPINLQFKLLTSNYPVNVGRVAANFVNAFTTLIGTFLLPLQIVPGLSRYLPSPRRAYENSNTLIALKERATIEKDVLEAEFKTVFIKKNNLNVVNNLIPEENKANYDQAWNYRFSEFNKGQAALSKINQISGFFQRMSNAISAFTTYGYKAINHNAERAALEQIAVSGLGGTRMGSCMSGKDREGATSIHVAAMEAFYAKYKEFPPIPGMFGMSEKAKELRVEYEKMAAEHFIANHDQIIAEANAPGAGGLKEVETILGKRIIAQIRPVLLEKYPNASENEKKYWKITDFANLTHAIASLNKPGSKIKPPKQWVTSKASNEALIPTEIINLQEKVAPPVMSVDATNVDLKEKNEKIAHPKRNPPVIFTRLPDGREIDNSPVVAPTTKPVKNNRGPEVR